jgi:glyceraldehyde 3-phosphate dehydrogenase
MKKTRVAINGFGRIGRNTFRIYAGMKDPNFEIVLINGPRDAASQAHLLKYDTLFGKFDGEVYAEGNSLFVNGKEVKITSERKLENMPWAEHDIDIVIEASGAFRTGDELAQHIARGAKKVLLTAPGKKEDITIVMGVNEQLYDPAKHNIISNASCTTNCLAPFAKVLLENFGIVKGLMTTIHSYTNDQRILDGSHSDLRRARAAAENIIPTTTGAAQAVALVIPELKGKFNGFSLRVPTPTVSIVDMVVETEKKVTAEEVNAVLKAASEGELKGILGFSDEPLVSMDYKMDERSSIIDGLSTMVIGDNLLKVVSWYDNEWGYSARVVDLVAYMVAKGI